MDVGHFTMEEAWWFYWGTQIVELGYKFSAFTESLGWDGFKFKKITSLLYN